MGCASSSPLAAANGKIMDAAKGAAEGAVHAGEDALADVKSTVTETVSNVKEAVVEVVHNVGHGIESAFHGGNHKDSSDKDNDAIKDSDVMTTNTNSNPIDDDDDPDFKHIPLKDPTKAIAPEMSATALNKLSEVINSKSAEYQDDVDKLADDLIKETDDIATDTIGVGSQHLSKSINQTMNSASTAIDAVAASPVHSLNSLETNSPEPEIEKAMANGSKMNPPTPKPTYAELELLQSEISSIVNNGMDALDEATAKFENAVAKVSGATGHGPGQVLVSAEIYPRAENNRQSGTRSQMDSYITLNLQTTAASPLTEEKILARETDWEKFADQLVKVPMNKVQAYRNATQKPAVKRSSSVDNLLKIIDF